jgi:alkylation response protein AidB-like acyl-CoA dehydrogenase
MADIDLQAVRNDVAAWLKENWDPERPLAEWRSILADSGWGCPTWPVDAYGRGLTPEAGRVVSREFERVGAVGTASGSGMRLAAPTILAHGSEELQRRILRPTLTGESTWCQLFSEPGNGSDLAGLTTRAERDGDEWIVNGQKVWTTGARTAEFGMLLARTDWDAPKHRGISYFVLPMRQPGVEVRPLRQMNEYASFNEVFLTDARVPHTNLVGPVGGGWAAALTTLSHERGLTTALPGSTRHGEGRTVREAKEEADAYNRTYIWYPQRAGRADLVAPRARRDGVGDDPLIRQQVADLHAFERAAAWTADRARAARSQGRPPGAEGSIGKLAASEIARRSAAAHARIGAANAMLNGPDSDEAGIVAEILVSVPAVSIAGGTDEIQHNINGERVLGLPKEPGVDVDIPFREVRRN